ncbi:ECF transporter S component [Butyrivibrio sp.]|uniref:ECF transporter S component n=1 Tax=Butyrivibrio sp. TaxID=28121 RepID=UPI0025BC9D8A|nr:ECF transporter S component [Butyrivibrio sp.]MBE5836356.1 ECF transporter S component [Butyrivibrio sp.]
MKKSNSFGTKQIAITAILLAICLISQIFKSLSVFITGPVINACLLLTASLVNLPCAIALSVITPITAYFIAASPVMMVVPAIIPFIMLGNVVLVVSTHFILKKDLGTMNLDGINSLKLIIKAVLCSLLKAVFMGLTISLWLLPTFVPEQSPLRQKMPVFQYTFSVVQFITALIGFIYFVIIFVALKNYAKRNG